MTNYVICVRSVNNGKFGNEPGATYFLEVPSSKKSVEVDHKAPKNLIGLNRC